LKTGIAEFQFKPLHGDVEANLETVKGAAGEAVSAGASLLLLPELWSSGPLKDRGEAMEHACKTPWLLSELNSICEKNKIFIAGGLTEEADGGRIFNTLFVSGPDGYLGRYRKINLFPLMNEGNIFDPGEHPVDLWMDMGDKSVGVGCLICFDLRFPELSRTLAFRGVDILLVSALWPMARKRHFETLLMARAMENQCFVLASNACGQIDNTGFAGASAVVAPDGKFLGKAGEGKELLVCQIDLEDKRRAREGLFTARPPSSWPFDRKILDLESLKQISSRRKRSGQKLVFTNGCFDILHAGHVSYL